MADAVERIAKCRACGEKPILPVLKLGSLPLANALVEPNRGDVPEPRFPLELVLCPSCGLVQINVSVPPEILFKDYPYFSSYSNGMLAHVEKLVRRLIVERKLSAESRVIEIASNDGYLLQYYKTAGVPCLGIEPAGNVAERARAKGIPTLVEFFNEALGERLAKEGSQADVIHAHNVFAHVPNPNEFVAGLKAVLKPGGIAVIEAPYVRDLVEKTEFDTIYHEHFSYFSLTAVANLVDRYGLMVADVEHVEIHGGSLRYFIAHTGGSPGPRVAEMLAAERAWGASDPHTYENFAARVWRLGDELRALLAKLKKEGCRVAAYGASAKGSTLLNAFGIGADDIAFVVDRSHAKQGRCVSGAHIPILPPEALLEHRPDYVLLLTWNFAKEILEQQTEYLKGGGHFIVPIPKISIVPEPASVK